MKKNITLSIFVLIFSGLVSLGYLFGMNPTVNADDGDAKPDSSNFVQSITNGKKAINLGREDVTNALSKTINILAGAASTITLIFIVLGGIQYISSAGNQDTQQKAKNTLTWAVIGFILIITSWSLITYILGAVF